MDIIRILILLLILCAIGYGAFLFSRPTVPRDLYKTDAPEGMMALFPTSVAAIERALPVYIDDINERIERIKHVPADERTFANTMKALDDALVLSDLRIFSHVLSAIKYLHPSKEMRDTAQEALSKINAYFVDLFSDKQLYAAIKAYADERASKEELSVEERYFISETLQDFKRSGLELPDDELEKVKALQKELSDLSMAFGTNISSDNRTIIASEEELKGLPEDFIAALKTDDSGAYVLGLDYPTSFAVLESAESAPLRERMYMAFNNRGYPANEELLKQIIAKRDALAKLLGFASYAHLDLDDQMVKTPERAHAFLDNLILKSAQKERAEFEQLTAELPEGVQLTAEGIFKPWDVAYAKKWYKQKHYDIDEQKIAEYFPVEQTFKGLLSIYERFFSLQFEKVPCSGLWADDLTMLAVRDAHSALLGYLLLDLYPRDNKYSHAAEMDILPNTYGPDGAPTVGFAVVMANFPRAKGDKPPLFKRADVQTFFHEFGHALHDMLGRTAIGSFFGTAVKRDFVELPSQMLEEWLSDKQMLKEVSGHYQSGEPLPDDVIDRILSLKHLSTGYFVQRQASLAKLALAYFAPGADKEPADISERVHNDIIKHVAFAPETHFYTSFGHLTGYGAKYYGYLWSKVFALDLFAEIAKHGLTDPVIGKKYIKEVIGRGGSADPNELLRNFLGREPNDEAFFKDMGLQ